MTRSLRSSRKRSRRGASPSRRSGRPGPDRMLSKRRAEGSGPFPRRDLTRLIVGAILLVATLTGIFALDLFPQRLSIQEGDVAAADIVAPRTYEYVSQIETDADRE